MLVPFFNMQWESPEVFGWAQVCISVVPNQLTKVRDSYRGQPESC